MKQGESAATIGETRAAIGVMIGVIVERNVGSTAAIIVNIAARHVTIGETIAETAPFRSAQAVAPRA